MKKNKNYSLPPFYLRKRTYFLKFPKFWVKRWLIPHLQPNWPIFQKFHILKIVKKRALSSIVFQFFLLVVKYVCLSVNYICILSLCFYLCLYFYPCVNLYVYCTRISIHQSIYPSIIKNDMIFRTFIVLSVDFFFWFFYKGKYTYISIYLSIDISMHPPIIYLQRNNPFSFRHKYL